MRKKYNNKLTQIYTNKLYNSNNLIYHHSLAYSDGRIPLMGGNWKLNPTTQAEAKKLAAELAILTKDTKGVDIVVFPPSPFLVPVFSEIEHSNVKVVVYLYYIFNKFLIITR